MERPSGAERAFRLIPVAAAALLCLAPATASAATIAVSTTDDELGSGAGCSLREAVQAANANADYDNCAGSGAYGADTIQLGDGVYTLTRPGDDDTNSGGDLDLTGSVEIDGLPSGGNSAISGNSATRALDVRSGAATVRSVEISDGVSSTGAGGAISTEPGTSLILADSYVHASSAGTDGGGIRAKGSLAVTEGSTVNDNQAGVANLGGAIGGGIAYEGSAASDDLSIDASTVSGNDVQHGNGVGAGLGIAVSVAGQGLTISSSQLNSNGFGGGERGGGVYMDATASDQLTVTDSRLFQNFLMAAASSSFVGGGGIYVADGDLDLSSSEVDANQAIHTGLSVAEGGGVYVGGDGVIADSIVSGNTAGAGAFGQGYGGGVMLSGATLELRDSTISGNTASGAVVSFGGGLASGYLDPTTTTVVNSTLSGNQALTTDADASKGGGVHLSSGGSLQLVHSTVAANYADPNGGRALSAAVGTTLTARGSVLDAATTDVCAGTVASAGFNVARGTSCALDSVTGDGDVQNTNPQLSALADNGGLKAGAPGMEQPVRTMQIGALSPALDRVPAASCNDEDSNPLGADQRGFPRPYPALCDSGAYERYDCLGSGARTIGTPAGDTISGGPGPDVIIGLGGGDTISGGAGHDLLCGGDGDDTIAQGSAPDGPDDIGGGAGTDRASYAGRSNPIGADFDVTGDDGEDCVNGPSCEGDTIEADVEEVEGGSDDDLLIGDSRANGLIGNGGDDVLIGGQGADALLGLGGTDTASYEDRGAAEPVSVTIGTVSGNGNADDGTGDNLANGIEKVLGGAGGDAISGDGAPNSLFGLGGDDTLDGRGGADSLDGGEGSDTAAYPNGGAVNVDLAAQTAGGSQGADALAGIENATGSPQADALVGDAGPNVLDGAAGNDTVTGAGDADVLRLGAGADVAAAMDGVSDTIDCSGGGADTATVDETPPETYVACPNSDGDALLDLFDACPTQAGTMANGCPVPPPKPKHCHRGFRFRHGHCHRDPPRHGHRDEDRHGHHHGHHRPGHHR